MMTDMVFLTICAMPLGAHMTENEKELLLKTKRKHTAQQFAHEEAGKSQTNKPQHVVGGLPRAEVESFIARVLADVQRDQKVGKDAADIGRD